VHQLVKKNLIIIRMHGMYVKINVNPLLYIIITSMLYFDFKNACFVELG